MAANQSAADLNRAQSSKFWWPKSANPVKLMMCMEKYVLVKKNVYKWTKVWFATTSQSQKDSPSSKNTVATYWLIGKENVLGTAVNKEGCGGRVFPEVLQKVKPQVLVPQ